MPIREYHCRNCGKDFEDLEIDVTTGKVRCPACGSKKVDRKLSLFSSSRRGASCPSVSKRYT